MLSKAISTIVNSDGTGPLPCAVVTGGGGGDIALLIPERSGRFPASVSFMREPMIGWVGADGVHEFVQIEGPDGHNEFNLIKDQCTSRGLLVGEVGDLSDPDVNAAQFSLMFLAGHEPENAINETPA